MLLAQNGSGAHNLQSQGYLGLFLGGVKRHEADQSPASSIVSKTVGTVFVPYFLVVYLITREDVEFVIICQETCPVLALTASVH
jgi:hypothetical protein